MIVKDIFRESLPQAVITDDDEEFVRWEDTDLCKQIRTEKTPGLMLTAYRNRAGLSIVELANKTGIKYTNISAMEHDRRVIGLKSARKFAEALGCDYSRFIGQTL